MTHPKDPRRLTCRCIGVSSTRIVDEVTRRTLHSVAEVSEATRAGTGCGICHTEIEELLADLAGQEVPSFERLENQLVCTTESSSRIEGSLLGALGDQLAAEKLTLEDIDASGLDVTIRFDHRPAAETTACIERKLKKLVCADLVVKILP